MRERTISAAIIAVVVIAVFLAGQPWLTIGIAALAALAAVEVFRLLPLAGFPVRILPGVIFPPLAVLGLAWLDPRAGWVGLAVAAVLVVLAIDAFRRPVVRDGFLVWIGGSFSHVLNSSGAVVADVENLAVLDRTTGQIPAGVSPIKLTGSGAQVWKLAAVGTTVYAAGKFTRQAGGKKYSNLLAFNGTTGKLIKTFLNSGIGA